MHKPLKCSIRRIRLYLLAGVYTAPTFMSVFEEALHSRLRERGYSVEGGLLFPYGDWSRRLAPQLHEVWRDMRLPPERFGEAFGARQVLEHLAAGAVGPDGGAGPFGADEACILIGHSGGGTAALQAAALLRQRSGSDGGPAPAVVQIGSPRSPVPPELRRTTAYCYAAGPSGRSRDPVCRLGSWRLRVKEPGRRLPRFVRTECPPGSVYALRLRGGHPDYFRTHLTDGRGRSNLSLTLEAVWDFLERELLFEDGRGEGS